MPSILHTAEDKVILEAGELRYVDSLANLRTDLGGDFPGLPEGGKGRSYDQGGKHWLTGLNNERIIVGIGQAWAEGDAALAGLADIIAAKETRMAQA